MPTRLWSRLFSLVIYGFFIYEISSSTTGTCTAKKNFPVTDTQQSASSVVTQDAELPTTNKIPKETGQTGTDPQQSTHITTAEGVQTTRVESPQPKIMKSEHHSAKHIGEAALPPEKNAKSLVTQSIAETESINIDSDPTLTLPPLDDAAVGGIEQHQIPTFNEFHAMLSETDDSKSLKGGVSGDHGRMSTGANGKQSASASQPSPVKPSIVPEVGSVGRSQNGISTDQNIASGSTADVPASDRRDKAPLHTPDPSKVIPSHAESTGSQTAHPDEIKAHSNSVSSDPQSSHHVHLDEQQQQQQQQPQNQQQQHNHHQTTPDRSVTLRRNVASVACGAKLLDSSQAIKNAEAVLNANNDEYMNVPCSAEKWFVIEVCEPVQLRMIEVANYELFSSRVKSFKMFVSDRYPAKSWELVGQFLARDIKGLQNFHVASDKLIKFVKFELLEHYGSEHYCPLTMIRLFGLVSDDLDDDDAEAEVEAAAAAAAAASNRKEESLPKVIPLGGPTGSPDGMVESNAVSGQPSAAPEKVHIPNSALSGNLPSTEQSPSDSQDTPAKAQQPPLVSGSRLPEPGPRRVVRPDLRPKRFDPVLVIKPHVDQKDPQTEPVHQTNNADRTVTAVPPPQGPDSDMAITDTVLQHIPIAKSEACHVDNADQCPLAGANNVQREPPSSDDYSGQLEPENTEQSQRTPQTTGRSRTPASQSIQQGTDPLPASPDVFASSFDDNTVSSLPTSQDNLAEKRPSTFFQRAKEFLFNWFSSSVNSVFNSKLDEHLEVNLSDVPLCSRHLEAIDSLLIYGLLNTSRLLVSSPTSSKNYIDMLFPQLTESKRLGLAQLEHCLFYLQNWTESTVMSAVSLPFDSDRSLGRDLTLSFAEFAMKQHPGMWACLDASKRLDLALHQPVRTGATFKYTVLQLFIAFQYRERQRVRTRIGTLRIRNSDARDMVLLRNGDQVPQLDPLWLILSSHPMNRFSQCPKLPEFILTKPTETSSPATHASPPNGSSPGSERSEYSGSTRSPMEVPDSSHRNVNHSPPHTWIGPRGGTREEIVVPAALTGSRKDTLLMRLNNRVRLLERNVSVSMRYLEELSQSYRRQMERLSRSFNLTTAWLKATAQGAAERDQLQQTRIDELELRLANLVAQLRPGQLIKSASASSSSTPPSSSSNQSTGSGDNENPRTSTSKSSTVPTSLSPPLLPPPPTFDAPLDWTPTYGPWPQIEDEWLDEDGVVETEGEEDILDGDYGRTGHSSATRVRTDGRVSSSSTSRTAVLPSSRAISAHSPSNPSSHSSDIYIYRSCTEDESTVANELLDWLQLLHSWFTTPWSYISLVLPKHWISGLTPLSRSTIGLIYMALLHLFFAICSHLLIYWAWFRPRSHKWQSDLLALPNSSYPTWPMVSVTSSPSNSRQSSAHHLSQNFDHLRIPKHNSNDLRNHDHHAHNNGQFVEKASVAYQPFPRKEDNGSSYAANSVVVTQKPHSVCSQTAPPSPPGAGTAPSARKISAPVVGLTSTVPYDTPPDVDLPTSLSYKPYSPVGGRFTQPDLFDAIVKDVEAVGDVKVHSVVSSYPVFHPPSTPELTARNDLIGNSLSCNGQITHQPHTTNLPTSSMHGQLKLSKNAIRRRNRRERDKQKDQVHSR